MEALSRDPEPQLAFVGFLGRIRLGDAGAVDRFRASWVRHGASDRIDALTEIVWCNPPLPTTVLRVLIEDPCALVVPAAAGMLLREPTEPHQELLAAALDREWARLTGDAPPRDPQQHGRSVMHRSRIATLLEGGEAARELLPPELRGDAKKLEREGFADPSIIAAHALLHALPMFDEEFARTQLRRWTEASAPLLRFDALKLLGYGTGSVPRVLSTDPDPRIRALFTTLVG